MAQAPDTPPGREIGRGYELLSLGLTFGVAIVAFVGGGLMLDRWLHLTPLFTLIGTFGGSTLSFWYVYVKLTAEGAREKREREGPK
jgi:hypothetical protein